MLSGPRRGWAFALFAPLLAAGQAPVETPVARVDGIAIERAALDQEMERMLPVGAFHNVAPERRAQIRRSALDNLVDLELLYREGLRRGFAADEAKTRAILDETRARYADDSDTGKQLAQPSTRERLLEELRRALVIGRLIRSAETEIKVTDDEVRNAYTAEKERLRTPKIVEATELLVPVDPAAAPDAWETARRDATAARDLAQGGTALEKLAREASGTTPARVVRARRLHEGMDDPGLEPVLQLRTGAISAPIFTLRGYAVLRVDRVTAPRTLDFTEAEKGLHDELLGRERDRWLAALKQQLRGGAHIEILDHPD